MSSWFKIFYLQYVNTLKYVTNLLKWHNFWTRGNIPRGKIECFSNLFFFLSFKAFIRWKPKIYVCFLSPPCPLPIAAPNHCLKCGQKALLEFLRIHSRKKKFFLNKKKAFLRAFVQHFHFRTLAQCSSYHRTTHFIKRFYFLLAK